MILCSFFVPGRPVGKIRARVVRQGGRTWAYAPKEGATYEQLVATFAKTAMKQLPPTTRAVSLEVFLWRTPAKSWSKKRIKETPVPINKPDVDNVLKSVCDALNGVVWIDDVQVSSALIVRRWADYDGIDVAVSFDMGD